MHDLQKGTYCTEYRDTSISVQGKQKLPVDTIVVVEEIDGRRCRISQPCNGWLSMQTQNGSVVLERYNTNPFIGKYMYQVNYWINDWWLKPCMSFYDICELNK